MSYGLDDRGIVVPFPAGERDFSFLHSVQNVSGTHTDSYSMDTGKYFPGGKAA
jgi:hypothetical protein